jgi:Flp pilus assembly pilin Flp
MSTRIAAGLHAALLTRLGRVRRALDAEDGQGTVEYVGLAMSIGVLLLAVGSYLSGKDHGIGSIITSAIKSAIQQASGGAKSA